MDLKKFSGKSIVIQFKPGFVWYVHTATEEGVPLIKLESPQKPDPVVSPFLLGEVQEDGGIRICTDAGGELDVHVSSDAIFSVSVVHKSADAEVSTFARGAAEQNIVVMPSN